MTDDMAVLTAVDEMPSPGGRLPMKPAFKRLPDEIIELFVLCVP